MNRNIRMYAIVTLALGAAACSAGESATPSVARTNELDACALLTADEIEAATGLRPDEAVENDMGVVEGCMWTVDEPYPDYPIVSAILTPGAPETWEAFEQSLRDGEMGPVLDAGERVDVGRFGVFGLRQLVVSTRSDRVLIFSAKRPSGEPVGKEDVLALARSLVARLP